MELQPLTQPLKHEGETTIPQVEPEHEDARFERQDDENAILRSLRLLGFYNLVSGNTRFEGPKPAIVASYRFVLLGFTVHAIPFSVAIVLIFLNFKEFYYHDANRTLLQFVAKAHELSMQSSIAAMVLDFMRSRLAGGKGLPFGALGAFLVPANVAWLWSKECVGAYRAKPLKQAKYWITAFETLDRGAFVGFIASFIILSNVVGPSVAVAMQPREAVWYAGGSDFYMNETVISEIFPSRVSATTELEEVCANISLLAENSICPSAGWRSISENYLAYWEDIDPLKAMPEFIQINGGYPQKSMHIRGRAGAGGISHSIATTPMTAFVSVLTEIADLWDMAASTHKKNYLKRADVKYKISMFQPLVQTSCTLHYNDKANSSSVLIPQSVCNEPQQAITFPGPMDELTPLLERYSDKSLEAPTIQFLEPPQNFKMDNLSVLAFITIPDAWPAGKQLVGCTVQAVWAGAESFTTATRRNLVESSFHISSKDWEKDNFCDTENFFQEIRIDPKWADTLNPFIRESALDVFEALIRTIPIESLWAHKNDSLVEGYLESIISALVANGLSKTGGRLGVIHGTLRDDWKSNIFPTTLSGNITDYSIYELPPRLNEFQLSRGSVNVYVKGYGIGSSSDADGDILSSMAALYIYTMAVLAYFLLCALTKFHSTAWGSPSEWVILAMQSRPSRIFLRNMYAGVDTSEIFARRIRVVQKSETARKLELVFVDDEGNDQTRRVVTNEFYG
ncbi:hypothetical protein FQN57_001037 [Myotisia sp. PD_48]|nr:hypothetical protein FQN57_001037 [Myotisia sp. PD_48]